MTDKELLEAAARAADIDYGWHCDAGIQMMRFNADKRRHVRHECRVKRQNLTGD